MAFGGQVIERKIYNTDLHLKKKGNCSSRAERAVGLTSIASGTKIIVPTRLKPHQLIILDAVELELLERYNLIGFDQAPYDIDTNENCIFFVESSLDVFGLLISQKFRLPRQNSLNNQNL